MYGVQRILAVIKPTKKMLAFMQSLPGAKEDLSLSLLRRDCTALLIPAFTNPLQAQQFIDRHYIGIFNNELQSWSLPEDLHPVKTLDAFKQFFDVEFHSLVYDISEFDNLKPKHASEIAD